MGSPDRVQEADRERSFRVLYRQRFGEVPPPEVRADGVDFEWVYADDDPKVCREREQIELRRIEVLRELDHERIGALQRVLPRVAWCAVVSAVLVRRDFVEALDLPPWTVRLTVRELVAADVALFVGIYVLGRYLSTRPPRDSPEHHPLASGERSWKNTRSVSFGRVVERCMEILTGGVAFLLVLTVLGSIELRLPPDFFEVGWPLHPGAVVFFAFLTVGFVSNGDPLGKKRRAAARRCAHGTGAAG